MNIEITHKRCPLCGEEDFENLQIGLFGGDHCYCNTCTCTWNWRSKQIAGYDSSGRKTAAQAAIDARKQGRQDAGKKYGS